MSALIRLFLLAILTYLFVVIWLWNKAGTANTSMPVKPQLSQAMLQQMSDGQHQLQHGYVKSNLDEESFHSLDLARAISYIPQKSKSGNYLWQDSGGRAFAYAAQGLDNNHYFANSYLIGYEPYKTDKLWQPLVTLAMQKSYQYDHDQHGRAFADVWQNSKQAYFYNQGDCEDHSILLADWLISMGYDARVAIGRVPSGGHAWVVLFHQGKEYVIEATSKRQPRSLSDFSLAKYAPDYRPKYLFNRERFWVNTGTMFTTAYSGEHWQETSKFINSQRRPAH